MTRRLKDGGEVELAFGHLTVTVKACETKENHFQGFSINVEQDGEYVMSTHIWPHDSTGKAGG